MKLKLSSVFLLCFGIAFSQTDFRWDGKAYKTIYPKDLCQFMSNNAKILLIDVRTKGEFADTSYLGHRNIGHLKGAINIPVDDLEKEIPKLKEEHLGEPIVLYCSHSQRSRRASKLLEENGFTQVRNLNGGMTWMNQATEKEFACKKQIIVSKTNYKNIGINEIYNLIKNTKDVVIIDVRSAAEFENKDTLEGNNIGRIKKAINIPEEEIKANPSKLDAYKTKTILIYDNYGKQTNVVATLLVKKGFKKVYGLLGGLNALVGKDKETATIRKELLENEPTYTLLNVKETITFLDKNKDAFILDVRPEEEFNNQSKQPWKNLGRVKGAKNIPATNFDCKLNELGLNKNSKILVYGGNDAAACCKKLKALGFEHVSLIYGGLWDMVSAYANIDGFQNVRSYLENNEGLY
jgi:rhodanese-related sulfurtransferase